MSSQLTITKPRDKEMVPRILLRAIGLLLLLCVVLVSYARIIGAPPAALPPDSPIAKERLVVIFGNNSGSAKVLDPNGLVIADLAPSQGGFISGVWRALARERGKYGVAASEPVRLIQYQDGRLALHDTKTPWRIQLVGFGADNAAAFARLIDN